MTTTRSRKLQWFLQSAPRAVKGSSPLSGRGAQLARCNPVIQTELGQLDRIEAELRRLNETSRTQALDTFKAAEERSEALLRSETILEQQHLLLESAMHSIDQGVISVDNQGRFLVFNPAARHLLGMGVTFVSRKCGRRRMASSAPMGSPLFRHTNFPWHWL